MPDTPPAPPFTRSVDLGRFLIDITDVSAALAAAEESPMPETVYLLYSLRLDDTEATPHAVYASAQVAAYDCAQEQAVNPERLLGVMALPYFAQELPHA